MSSICPHNVTYGVKFLLCGESPRDYVDMIQSMHHIPTVNIIDCAGMVAVHAERTVLGLFGPHNGLLCAPTHAHMTILDDGCWCLSLLWRTFSYQVSFREVIQ